MALYGVPLLERRINLEIDEVYTKLKAAIVKKGYKVLHEEQLNKISFKQGSLWGLMPKTAKKNVDLVLEPQESATAIKCASKLSSDWKNVTLVGCVSAFVLVVVCVWMASDLAGVLATGEASFWSWLITVGGRVNSDVGAVFVNLVWGLAGFLSVVITLEIVIVVYVRQKIDVFAAEFLDGLR
jgi:hypothetical protein